MSEASPNTDAEQLTHELASLGEAPPSEAEIELLRNVDLGLDLLGDDPEVASVARLAELAEPLEFEDLSQLELHRTWRGVEQRLPDAAASPQTRTGGGVRPWLFAAVGVAAAAAVLLIVLQPGEDSQQARAPDAQLLPEQVAELAELGSQARTALRMLDDGQTDTERATQLATAYQRRLAQQPQQEEQGG